LRSLFGRPSVVVGLICIGLLTCSGSALAATLNLDTLSGAQAEKMMQDGQLTSVELTDAYLARIAALNKAGPGLNAVTQINPNALAEARQADQERAAGINLGPAMGLPIALKDIIDSTPMFNSAGDWALRNSYAPDSGVTTGLRAHGVVILGKLGLSEWANSFGSQPSGFSNLTGQVLNANDTIAGPSGSSSGSGAAASAGMSALTIGTETSGSIISPSTAEEDVGLRPTVGLVPGYGISPIDVSQDTAGPIVRTVTDAAMTLQSIAEYPGSDPTASQEYLDLMGPNYLGSPATGDPNGLNDIPGAPSSWSGHLPNYMSALTTSFVQGKRIGYNSTCTGFAMSGTAPNVTYTCTSPESSQQASNDAAVVTLANAGATMVSDPTFTAATETNLPSSWEAHATIDEYYKGINPQGQTPTNLAAEVAYDNTDPQEAEKDGNSAHSSESLSDDSTITNPSNPTPLGTYNQAAFDAILPYRKLALHSAIDTQLACPSNGVTTNSTTVVNLPTATGAPGGGGPTTVNTGSSSCPVGHGQPRDRRDRQHRRLEPRGGVPGDGRSGRIHLDAASPDRCRHQRRAVRGVRHPRRWLRAGAGPTTAAATGDDRPCLLPVRAHRAGGAVCSPRALQPGLPVDHVDARRGDAADADVRPGDGIGRAARGDDAGRGADVRPARQG
jgi:Asp-tRNA(Asn)/Glu-tRNA(Gln) amidotransferase A subunit family amidase